MMRWLKRSPWRLPLALLLASAALGALIGTELGLPPTPQQQQQGSPELAARQGAETTDADASADDAAPTERFTPHPLESYAEIVERPLFSSTRHPAPKALGAGGSATQTGDTSLQLVGVVLAKGRRLALVQAEGVPRLLQVEVGGDVQGWKVETIAADRVTLRSGEHAREITLADRAKAVAAMAGANHPPNSRAAAQPERGPAKAAAQPANAQPERTTGRPPRNIARPHRPGAAAPGGASP
jgi:hypothetical protein